MYNGLINKSCFITVALPSIEIAYHQGVCLSSYMSLFKEKPFETGINVREYLYTHAQQIYMQRGEDLPESRTLQRVAH